jgi:hypothetical protein
LRLEIGQIVLLVDVIGPDPHHVGFAHAQIQMQHQGEVRLRADRVPAFVGVDMVLGPSVKPPKATRFKKGKSGNPSGRPRKPAQPFDP